MRHASWLALGAACLLAGAPAAAHAQVRFELTPVLGPSFFLVDPPETFALAHGDADVVVENGKYDDGFTAGAFAGFRLGDRWAVEGMFSWLPTKLSGILALEGRKADVNAYMYGLDVAYYLVPGRVIEPYLSVGVGAETFDYRVAGVDTHSDVMWNLGLGAGYRITEWLGLRVDVRDCLSNFGSRYPDVDGRLENDLMVQAGLRLQVPVGGQ